jgi:NADH-quinone oxidoreductase subunit F
MVEITGDCIACTACVEQCPKGAIVPNGKYSYKIDQSLCLKCYTCVEVCEEGAIVWKG